MKTILTAITITTMAAIMAVATLDALDKSIYPGCRVVEQIGNQLVIELTPDLRTGTDTSCLKAERLIKKINRSGYDVIILTDKNTWVPKVAPITYKEDWI